MTIAIFGKDFSNNYTKDIKALFKLFNKEQIAYYIYEPFIDALNRQDINTSDCKTFSKKSELKEFDVKVLVSIGGDGTILQAATMVVGTPIPIFGINTGRMGFLSTVSFDNLSSAIQDLKAQKFTIEKRNLLSLKTNEKLFGKLNFALNDLTIARRDVSAMIKVQVFLNEEYLNTYWSDGLIISTATGSTAYSLSCGGPVVYPNTSNFIITPIAPHNLNVRPLVVPDDYELTLMVEGRHDSYLVSLDSRTEVVEKQVVLKIKKHHRRVGIVRLKGHSYLQTIREKLSWGIDKRN